MRPRREEPLVHSWTGDEDIPSVSRGGVLVEEAVLAGSGIPATLIQERANRFEVVDSPPLPGWRRLSTPRGSLHGDVPDEGLRTAGVYIEEMNALLKTALGGSDTSPFYVRMFKDAKDFRALASIVGAPNAESYYDPRSQEMVFWFGQYATPELFQRAFAHEFTHAYMDKVWNLRTPIWFMEGMAEYYSDLEWNGAELVAGQLNRRAALLLNMQIIPLADLFKLPREEFYGIDFPYFYAQAWAFVHFLYNRAPDAIDHLLNKDRGEKLADMDGPFMNYVRNTIQAV